MYEFLRDFNWKNVPDSFGEKQNKTKQKPLNITLIFIQENTSNNAN